MTSTTLAVVTITSEAEHLAPWRAMDEALYKGKSALRAMVDGVASSNLAFPR